jgi:hypothetical protein
MLLQRMTSMMDDCGNTVHTFNRFEFRYVLSLQQAERFKSDLQAIGREQKKQGMEVSRGHS